jgi:SagB-type dehydrogenase family enzyme
MTTTNGARVLGENVSGARVLSVVSDLTVRPSIVQPDKIALTWGEGSQREEFVVDSPAVGSWILTLSPNPHHALVTSAELTLGIRREDAVDLIDALERYGLLTRSASRATADERVWDSLGWADALAFHRATRHVLWRHEYPPGAQVYTFVHRDKLVIPDEPRPGVSDEQTGAEVSLPPPSRRIFDVDLQSILRSRRTARNFQGTEIDLADLSDVLHWSLRRVTEGKRNYFSARVSSDVSRPDEAYPFVTAFVLFGPGHRPAGIERGSVFRYSAQRHTLVAIEGQERTGDFSSLLWDVTFADGAPVAIVLATNWAQYMWKYRLSHFYRMAHYDLGSFAQTILMVATALDLRSFLTPAIDDVAVEQKVVADPGVQAPVYLIALGGRPRSQQQAGGEES